MKLQCPIVRALASANRMAILIAVQVQQRSSDDGKETTNTKILLAIIALSKVP